MKEPLEAAAIRQYCQQLRLPTLAAQFAKLADQAMKEKKSNLSYLEALLAVEVEEREQNVVRRRIHEARFEKHKTLEEFHFDEAPHLPVALIRSLAARADI